MDLVCKDGASISKKGKFGGRKYTYRCPHCLTMDVSLSPNDDIKCSCSSTMSMIEVPLLKAGKKIMNDNPAKIRGYVMAQLKQLGEL